MKRHRTDDQKHSILLSLGLAGAALAAWAEISMWWTVEQNWSRLLSSAGSVTVGLYLLLLTAGLVLIVTSLWGRDFLRRGSRRISMPLALRWLSALSLLLFYTYLYLFSVWQAVLAQPWLQLLFAAGFVQILQLLLAPDREPRPDWSELALTAVLFLYPRVIQETRALFTDPMVYRAATAAGFALVLVMAAALYSAYGEKARSSLIAWRERIDPVRTPVLVLLFLIPLIYRLLVDPETYILYDDIRFTLLVIAVWLAAFLVLTGTAALVTRETLGLSLGVLLFVSLLVRYSFFIIDYPFPLSWSEGNRFYDYSLIFGQSLYNSNAYIINPYSSPGRYGLWGILFLWQGLPIWAHRLWNILLLTLPPLLFSFVITRRLAPPALRYGVLLWMTLFLTVLAPLHPPFILVSIIAVAWAFDPSVTRRGIALAVAGLYAGLSRWTWAFAPAAIGVIIDLVLYYPRRTGSVVRRLLPAALLASISLVAGLLPSLGQYFSLVQGDSLTSGQPLLWYRLLPNDTLGPGVLFLALRYTLPLWILLAWWMVSRRWQLDWIQKAAIWIVLLAFFGIGLVISTKIGGGGDLHNLDMYLITLLVVSVLGLMSFDPDAVLVRWPVWAVALVYFLIFLVVYPFLPLHPGSDSHPRLSLPGENKVSEAFSAVRTEVEKAAQKGEILFMDHRQLLTFGYLPAVPFVPEYEKKYMMDQAMANQAEYFQPYYRDLAENRFALIVTEPLRTKRREELGGPFSEENDAWVTWVSNPTLCFYEPLYVSTDVNLALLVPRQDPLGCEHYLD